MKLGKKIAKVNVVSNTNEIAMQWGRGRHGQLAPLLLTWIEINPSMDK